MSQKQAVQSPSKGHGGAGEALLNVLDIPRTVFGIDLALRPKLDARKINDSRMDFWDKEHFAIECRYVFGTDPNKTYLEFLKGYDGKKPLVIYLLEKLKAEKTPLKHQIFARMPGMSENVEESYSTLKGIRLVPFDGLSRE